MAMNSRAGARVSSDNFSKYTDYWAIGTSMQVAITELTPGVNYKAKGLYQVGDTIYVESGAGHSFTTAFDNWCYFENKGVSSVTLSITNTMDTAPDLEYSLDKENWVDMGFEGAEVITVPAGGKVYLRGDNESLYQEHQKQMTFSSSGPLYGGGNIMTLLDRTGASTSVGEEAFRELFHEWTNLVAPPDMSSITEVSTRSFFAMYRRCSSLSYAPTLSAERMAQSCYAAMFIQCTSLTTAPELPSVELADSCYYQMFQGCTALTSAPELPADTLATYCYGYMFSGCTSLEEAPALPATTMAQACYATMFENCTALTSAPELNCEELARWCYANMFFGCTNLDSLTINMSSGVFDPNKDGTWAHSDWLRDTAATGTLHAPSHLDGSIPTNSNSGCPSGWELDLY